MRNSVYVALPLLALLALLQTAVLPFFPVFHVSPQLPLLVALSWGLLRGIDEGVVWAFVAGLFMDLFSITPMGLSSLTFMVSITAVLLLQNIFPSSQVLIPIIAAALTTLLNLVLQLIALRILGFTANFNAVTIIPPITLLNTIAMLPIYWGMAFILRTVQPRRVQL